MLPLKAGVKDWLRSEKIKIEGCTTKSGINHNLVTSKLSTFNNTKVAVSSWKIDLSIEQNRDNSIRLFFIILKTIMPTKNYKLNTDVLGL